MQVKEILKWAFAEIVQSSTPMTEGEEITALRYLNRMMAKLAASGLDVGYTRISDLEAEMTSPACVNLAMVKNLAVMMWPQYNTDPINPLLKYSADRALKTMQSFAVSIDRAAQFPDTFPLGSGNQYGVYTDRFYSNDQGETKYIPREYPSNG